MDSVKWAHSTGMEPDDVMVSDNLLDFVKDEDIVNALDTHDDILQQGYLFIYSTFFLYFNYKFTYFSFNNILFLQIFSTK